MSDKNTLGITAAACLFLAATPASAILLSATDAGFVTSVGGSAKGDGTIAAGATYNYSTQWEVHYSDGSLGMPPGTTPLAAMNRKNYFVFDLSSITDPIVSATFIVNSGTYESTDASETLELHAPGDVGAALSDAEFLLTENGVGTASFDEPTDPAVGVAAALYGIVTSGPVIGTEVIALAEPDDSDRFISIDPGFLNAHLGSKVIFGGELSTLTMAGTPEGIFGFTGPDIGGGSMPALIPKLDLTLASSGVPEPSTFLLGSVLLGFFVRLRRRGRS